MLFCAREYAGLLPGSLKNLLEWAVGGVEMNGKPAAWINVAAPGRGDGAQKSLTDPGFRASLSGVLQIITDTLSAGGQPRT